jgi:hypothetical protein
VPTPYRVPPPIEPDPYAEAWKTVRRSRRVTWFTFLGWVPVGGLIMATVTRLFGDGAAPFVAMLMGAWLLFTVLSLMKAQCPRCAKPLLRTRTYGNPLSRKCLHCGLAIGTAKADA